jgi:hypothetical protein
MNIQTLIPCPKCSHSISFHAEQCPNCRTNVFNCVICGKHGNYDDYSDGAEGFCKKCYESIGKRYHRSCLAPYFAFPDNVRCPDCHRSLRNSGIDEFNKLRITHPCPYCGRPSPLLYKEHCTGCSLPIFDFQRRVTVKNCIINQDDHYHDFCAQIREARIRSGWPETSA